MPIYIYTAGKSYIQTEILKENKPGNPHLPK